LSATACDWLEYARCRLIGHGTRDERPSSTLWTVREPISPVANLGFFRWGYFGNPTWRTDGVAGVSEEALEVVAVTENLKAK